MKRVRPRSAMQSHAALASNRGGIRQVAPVHSAQETTLMIPCTWCSGKHRRISSLADHSQASTRLVICAVMLAWVVTTPLGRFDVPLVYRIKARRSALMFEVIVVNSGVWGARSWSYNNRRMPRAVTIGDSREAAGGSQMSIDALASSMKYSSSGLAALTGNGTAIPPALQMPH